MDRRIRAATVVAVVVSVPVLLGCGSGTAVSSGTAAPDRDQAAAPVATAAGVDPALETQQVQAATEKFVTTVLTIGYPDRTFAEYTHRIEPLMTRDGFATLETADSIKQGSTALTSLYAQHARTAPTFAQAPRVTALGATGATAELAYENEAQQRSGRGWKTLKSLGTGSVTVRLVREDGTWLVDAAA